MCNFKGVKRTGLQISLLLLLIGFFFRKCIRLIVQVTEQNKCLFHNFYGWLSNLNQFKRSIPESFKYEYTILPVPRPSAPPLPLVAPSPSVSMLDLDCAESQAHTKPVCNICMREFHRKTANIDQGQRDLSTYLTYSEIAKWYFGFERVSGFSNHSVWT